MADSASPTASAATPTFAAVPAKPDHVAIERHVLDVWEQQGTFNRLRASNAGGPKFSFVDGPITANNPMGVHHAWGRTLKDIYQRWYALRGYDQRYQNGFDCQGLWVEVEVEKALNLNSKQEIEQFGLDRFSRACRDRVAEFSEVQTRQSIRLGQWMDWDNDYYTLSDTNISYIWTFLAECHRRGWLYVGHRPMTWCPRCGTSLSQHELIDSYQDVTHPSLFVRFPLLDDAGNETGESVMVWTTTPWTLPANVAAAVRPEATYALVESGVGPVWMVSDRVEAVFGADAEVTSTTAGSDLVGRRYRGVFADLPGADGADYRVVGWDEVGLDEGSGIVHIAPGCGAEDYELGKAEGLATIQPVDESGTFFDSFGFLSGIDTHAAAPAVIEDLKRRGVLVRAQQVTHRFPSCWRCGTELIFRLVDEWFISCDQIREQMIEANRNVEWSPAFYGKRMEDWLNNMGDWCISRKRYWGLPLPFYRDPDDESGDIFVVDSREQLLELAVEGTADNLVELHRPWIDGVKIRHPETGRVLERVTEVGDCWLDAGIVPFSTLGWKSERHVEGGYATGASVGLSGADLPSHEEWEQWFPADVVMEMREQIRLWFYSLLFMSVVLEGRAPYRRVLAYEKVHDETGRAMHKSWGNAIWFDDAVEQMGADVMRWQYAGQTPSQNLNFGYGPATEIKRRFLTLWNVYGFFVQYANVDGWAPPAGALDVGAAGDGGIGMSLLDPSRLSNPLDQWLAARTHQLVSEVDQAFSRWDTPACTRSVERFIEELSNWYVRRSRRRFWKAELGDADRDEGYQTLWGALVVTARVLAPVMPFLADELWSNLVGSTGGDGTPDSVHLAGWPEHDVSAAGHRLLDTVDAVQRIVGLGRAARSSAKLKLRQPLREVVVFRRRERGQGTAGLEALLDGHHDDVLGELSIKTLTLVDDPGGRWIEGLMPLLPRLGPKYGADIAKIRAAVAGGDVEILEDGRARVGEFTLDADEYENRSSSGEGWAVSEDHEWVVAVATTLDEELVREGLAREVVRALQALRKDSGLEITDRISVQWHCGDELAAAIEAHAASVAEEVLATSFERVASAPDGAASSDIDGHALSVRVVRA